MTDSNPLLAPWTTPFEAPPFSAIEPAHFQPAFDEALAEHAREIEAIAADPTPPTFANTIEALERAGQSLQRVSGVFFNLTGAHTNDDLQAVERTMAPLMARHRNAIYLKDALFARVDALVRSGAPLHGEPARVLERYHRIFVRSGAGRPPEVKARLAEIAERLAVLGTTFSQNVLKDEKAFELLLDSPDDLAGLPPALVDAAAMAAQERGHAGRYAITLSRSSVEPFLGASTRRDLRETMFRAWTARGEQGATDNRPIIAETVALRAERAKLLGFASFAHFRLDDTMAKTPDAALDLLRKVWEPALRHVARDRATLGEMARQEGDNAALAPWDWRYYAERVRQRDFGIDEAQVKPFMQLDRMIDAAFDTAGRLFGLTFTERHDVPVFHPDVRAFEVKDRDGALVGLFLGDYFARPSKRSGAWMSAFRGQEKLDGEVRPIIVNVMNFSKPPDGEAALLSFDDARTLFHEFGHALHGLLSDVTYPMIAGTSVPRDFVEFPSQLYEHWLEQPTVLARFAVHAESGEPMPADLLRRMLAARHFNQAFSTIEFISSAWFDLQVHLDPAPGPGFDVGAFERDTLAGLRMPDGIVMRHRPPHFAHVFAGEGYAAGYYSYLWSEVLDADGFGAFEEAGDIFDPTVAQRLRDFVYAAGGTRDPADAYRAFRGRLPEPEALLRQRGLVEIAAEGEI